MIYRDQPKQSTSICNIQFEDRLKTHGVGLLSGVMKTDSLVDIVKYSETFRILAVMNVYSSCNSIEYKTSQCQMYVNDPNVVNVYHTEHIV